MNRVLLIAAFALQVTVASASSFTLLDRDAARNLTDPDTYATPTVVALWSSDCAYCKENLGMLGRLSRRRTAPRIITVVTESEQPTLHSILDAARIRGPRYAYGSDAPEAINHALDPAWRGELPRTLLFDGRGNRIAISGKLDEAAVLRLISASSASRGN